MNSLPSTPCYLNGAFTPLCDAKISVMDRGFIFGDGIYEVVPVYNGRPFRFAQHMARLERSLVEMRMANPHTREQWLGIAMGLIGHGAKAEGVAPDTLNQLVYIQVTRGVAMRDHVMPTDIERRCLRHCRRLPLGKSPYQEHQPARLGIRTPDQL